jgi:histidine triad (HIT) family protein
MEESIFTKIINGDIPHYKIAENDKFLAFLDLMPLRIGHTLVVPKNQIDYIYDLSDEMLGELMVFSKVVAKKIETKIKCKRIGVAVIGLEVPHAHIHLIPIDSVSDMDFKQPKLSLEKEEMKKIADLINGFN